MCFLPDEIKMMFGNKHVKQKDEYMEKHLTTLSVWWRLCGSIAMFFLQRSWESY